MATNSRPLIPDTDHGIWRRIQVIPFEQTFTVVHGEGDRIRRALWEERNGILAWAIEGCLQWQKVGLKPPPEVTVNVDSYRDELDNATHFMDNCCYLHPDASIPISDLYIAYIAWCKREAERYVTKIEFGRNLTHKGFNQFRKAHTRYWSGIAISNRVSLTNLSDTDPGDQPIQDLDDED
jgi:putative DNA primase/helicase